MAIVEIGIGPLDSAGVAATGIVEHTTLRLAGDDVYAALNANAQRLGTLVGDALTAEGVPHQVAFAGNLMSVFFTDRPVRDYADAAACETWRFPPFFHALLDAGVYPPPSAFEAFFVNAAMDDDAFATIEKAVVPAARAAAAAAKP